MCNNILQYGHFYAWGREHGRQTMSMRFSFKFQYFHICNTPHHHFLNYVAAKYAAKWGFIPTLTFNEPGADTTAQELEMFNHKHIAVAGWEARWYDLFLKYKQEIIDLFAFKKSVLKACQPLLARSEGRCRLGVHIRRGDYATWNDGRFFYELSEYHAFMLRVQQLYSDRRVAFFISSNEDFQLSLFEGCTCQRFGKEPSGAILDLYTLSLCDRIMGPFSSYSRWASFINRVPLCFLEEKEQQFTEESFSSIVDFFHFENGKEIFDW